MELKNFDFTMQPGLTKTKDIIVINKKEKPLISILTAYYNAKEHILETANSIFNQTFPYWEWIIIDDGSTEKGTKEFLEELSKKDSRIKILKKKNGGCSSARYFGAKHALSDIVYFLDADDVIDPTMLECGYWTLKTNPGASWAYSNSVGFGNNKYLYKKHFDSNYQKKDNLLVVASFIKKDVLLEFKEYENLDKDIYEDWYMWMNFLSKGYYPVRMNFYGFWYRRLESSLLSSITKNQAKHEKSMKKISEISSKITNKIEAIQYPILTYTNSIIKTDLLNWDKKLNYKDKKEEILFIIPWSVVGGADKFNIDLISGLDKTKYRLTVLFTIPSDYIWRQKLEKHATVFDLTTFLKKEEWFDFIHYIIKSRDIKLIFNLNSMYGYHAIPLIKASFPKIPIVDYLHNEDMSWNNGGYPRESVIVSHLLDKTYTCTKYLKNLMFDVMERKIKNVETIYIGTDEKQFNPQNVDLENNEIFKKINGKKVVLFPSRLTEQKRPFLLVEIMKETLKKRDDIIFLVVGDGNLKDQVVAKTSNLNLMENVIFLPNQKDMRPYYKMANVTLICSMYEGLTLTAYESLAMNKPVITSDVGGQSELVDDSCGVVIPLHQNPKTDVYNYNYTKEEIDEYCSAIIKILKNPPKTNCREKIEKQFTIDKMVQNFEKEIEKLLKSGSKITNIGGLSEDFARNYLTKLCMLDRDDITFASISTPDEFEHIKEKLWKSKLWRKFVKTVKKDENSMIYKIAVKSKKTIKRISSKIK